MQFGGDDLGLDFDMGGGEFAPATLRPEDPQSDNESRSSRKRACLWVLDQEKYSLRL